MAKILFELDMDGVFADFLTPYLALGVMVNMPVKPPYSDNSRNPELFQKAVLEHDIFAQLPLMPRALELKKHIEQIEMKQNIQIRMLTCLNSNNHTVMSQARKQKQSWLDLHGFKWEMQCVSTNAEKSNFATPNSILIDDNPECVTPFIKANGQAILYKNFNNDFVYSLNKCMENIY